MARQPQPSTTQRILQQRGERYGKFADHADCSQQLKAVLRNHMGADKWNRLTASQQEALEMLCHKLGRIANGDPNYEDTWRDLAGYSTLVADELIGIQR